MKKAMIALSAILVASPVFAATTTHATDDTVAAAHENANTAKEKLHQAQNQGEEMKLKSKHAAEGKSDSVGSQISEGTQKTRIKPKKAPRRAGIRPKKALRKAGTPLKKAPAKVGIKPKKSARKAGIKPSKALKS